MITAKLRNNIINYYDGEYDRETLKRWAEKDILMCPTCNKSYEYCHGKIVPPYFRHKDKEKCLYEYYEPETKEHVEGKIILFEWVKSLNGVTDVVLEGWIPETRQRPDVMFKIDDKQYIIEFQCSPIASEYFKRHELYQAAGVHDIWVLGLNNYNLDISNSEKIKHSQYYKTIENYHNFYLDYQDSSVFIKGSLIRKSLLINFVQVPIYNKFNLYDMEINCIQCFFCPKYDLIQHFKIEDNKINEMKKREEMNEKLIINSIENIKFELNHFFETKDVFSCRVPNNSYYIGVIECEEKTFFIKSGQCDYCTQTEYSAVIGTGKRGGPRWGKKTRYINHDSVLYSNFNSTIIINFIKKHVEYEFNVIKERRKRISELFESYFDRPIYLLQTSKEKIDYGFRFKFIDKFEITDNYMETRFINELRFLDERNLSKYVFMIPRNNDYYDNWKIFDWAKDGYYDACEEVIKYFNSIGFKKVKFYDKEVDII